MAWFKCDQCEKSTYPADNPFVEMRQPRPSNRTEMCCVLAGHKNCIGAQGTTLPSISEGGGCATPDQWEEWIESDEACKAGFLFLG